MSGYKNYSYKNYGIVGKSCSIRESLKELTEKLKEENTKSAASIFIMTANLMRGLEPLTIIGGHDILIEKILYKLARVKSGYNVEDSLLDIAGYALLLRGSLIPERVMQLKKEDTLEEEQESLKAMMKKGGVSIDDEGCPSCQ